MAILIFDKIEFRAKKITKKKILHNDKTINSLKVISILNKIAPNNSLRIFKANLKGPK